ncbi:MAG: hypothetical protein QXK12_06490 [Candidatus Nezhaarchaeales archaeon]
MALKRRGHIPPQQFTVEALRLEGGLFNHVARFEAIEAVRSAVRYAKKLEAILKTRSSYKALTIYDAYLKGRLSLSEALAKLTSKEELASFWRVVARVDWLPWSENYFMKASLNELKERLYRALS